MAAVVRVVAWLGETMRHPLLELIKCWEEPSAISCFCGFRLTLALPSTANPLGQTPLQSQVRGWDWNEIKQNKTKQNLNKTKQNKPQTQNQPKNLTKEVWDAKVLTVWFNSV